MIEVESAVISHGNISDIYNVHMCEPQVCYEALDRTSGRKGQ